MKVTSKQSLKQRDAKVRDLRKSGKTEDFIKSYMRIWGKLQKTQDHRHG